jgi:hypothetical protein
MPKTRPPYTPEFRRRLIELVRRGRMPEGLGRQFEPVTGSGSTTVTNPFVAGSAAGPAAHMMGGIYWQRPPN